MKAITIHQPWASLIAIGAKRFETRGWKTNYRGPIAIHASKKDPAMTMRLLENHNQVYDAFYRYGFKAKELAALPTGVVVATANLTECYQSKAQWEDGRVFLSGVNNGKMFTGEELELVFGDFTPGRYAWEMSNVKMLDKPIPAKGQQGLWNWNPPEGVDWICKEVLASMN